MKRNAVLYLDDMLTYAREAHEFVQGMTTEAFIRDTRTRYAVGEAARNVPSQIRERYPQIPWQKIIGMRNRLATTTWERVWTSFLRRRESSRRS